VEEVKIRRQRGIVRMVVLCSFFVAGISLRASACSYSSNPAKIGRNFSVQVLYRSQPLAGLQIELSTDPKGNENSRPILTTSTNKNGLSEFSNVRPGPYYISIKDAAFPQSTEIVVNGRRTNSRKEKLTFEWPGFALLSVRSVSGLLNAPVRTANPLNEQAHPTFGALGGVKLTLLRAVTNEMIEAQSATESGAFAFESVPAGLYVLHIEMAENMSNHYHIEDGYVPIELDPMAKASTFNLFLYPGVCGALGYEDRQESATN
jgi:hypothetical protein